MEQDYRECKGALGLDHYQGRSFGGWHHHVERHEALWDRVEVRDLCRRLVAAGRLKLGAA